jgi:hypothetical protein
LRQRLAYDGKPLSAVERIFVDSVLGFYRRRMRAEGVTDGRSGSVTVVQRCNSDLKLNIHYRVLLTARTEQDVLSRESKQQLWPGKIGIDRTDRWKAVTIIVAIILSVGGCVDVGGRESGRVLELGIDVARCQQAEVANLYELVE